MISFLNGAHYSLFWNASVCWWILRGFSSYPITSAIHYFSGYYQISIAEHCRDLTAFHMMFGLQVPQCPKFVAYSLILQDVDFKINASIACRTDYRVQSRSGVAWFFLLPIEFLEMWLKNLPVPLGVRGDSEPFHWFHRCSTKGDVGDAVPPWGRNRRNPVPILQETERQNLHIGPVPSWIHSATKSCRRRTCRSVWGSLSRHSLFYNRKYVGFNNNLSCFCRREKISERCSKYLRSQRDWP